MPYPAQIHYDTLINTAHHMIETDGYAALSLSKLAAAFGVKAPSIYKHVSSKADLVKAVNLLTNQRMQATILAASESTTDPLSRLLAIVHALRRFAHSHPHTYTLAYATNEPDIRPAENLLEALALPIQAVMAVWVGEANSLAALRGLWALVHGYVLLELHGQLQRGGDLDATFDQICRAYLQGWQKPSPF